MRRPAARRLLGALVLAWVSFGMLVLGVFLVVQHATGSSGMAGLAVAAETLFASVFAPFRGRLVDRRGVWPWLPAMAGTYGGGLVGLAVAASAGAPAWLFVGFAAVSGAASPPLVATTRALWASAVPPAQLRRAYGLTSLVCDAGMVGGPPLCGALFLVAPWAPAAGSALAAVASALVLLRPGRAARCTRDMGHAPGGGLLARPGVTALLAVSVVLGVAMGVVDVATPAAAVHWDRAGWAGPLLAMFALGSILAGLWFGRRGWRAPALRRYMLATALMGLLLTPGLLAHSPVALAGVLLVAGAAYGPATVSLFECMDDLLPDRGTEALTWVTSAEVGGVAAGAGAAGWGVPAWGPGPVFAVSGVLLAVSALAAVRPWRRARAPGGR